MASFPNTTSYILANARVAPVLTADGAPTGEKADAFELSDIVVRDGRIASLEAPGRTRAEDLVRHDLRGGIVLPRFVDMHTHIDKGHIFARSPNPDGTFLGARMATLNDRENRWSADDVRARMDFAMRCAYAHGTSALRTHLDSLGKQAAISWPVFAEVREAWRGRIELQAVALQPTELAIDDEPQFKALVDIVAKAGGVLGGLTFMGNPPDEKLDRALDRAFQAASAHGLDLDFHVDESDSADARSLEQIALAALRNKFKGRITAGHCCSLALQSGAHRTRVIERIGEAGIAVVSLPMCNMYLQDRTAGRTPRWRGIAPLHELDKAGIAVAVASDNTRDPFYAYGDLDMLEVFREATRIAQFDHTDRPWLRLMGPAPAEIMRTDNAGILSVDGPADFIITRARTLNELLCRPWSDRIVVVDGKAIDTTLPDYSELDQLS